MLDILKTNICKIKRKYVR